jgi:glycosyltransferase involved in cell wall biosynthesis
MRLAIIASLLPSDTKGGAERYVGQACISLAEEHDVVILSGSPAGRVDGLPVVRLPRLPELAPDAPTAGRILWHALDQWLPSVHLTVARELRRFNPDVVLTHHPQGLSAAVFTAVAQVGAPHVHTAHDLNLLCARMTMTREGEFCGGQCTSCRIQRTIRGRAIRLNLSRLVGVSQYISDRHIRAGIVPEERARTIRLGASPGRARQRHVSRDAVTLGFIGTLGVHKGILTLLAAFERAPSSWRLFVAGSGTCESAVRDAAARDRRIQYIGHVDGDTKDAFFDELDLVVIPSEWEEPATFVAVEAAVRGIPAVVSARGGLSETPEARSFRSGDPDGLLAAMRWFVDQPEHLTQASARLLQRQAEFDWARHVREIDGLLEEVVVEEGGGTSLSSPAG